MILDVRKLSIEHFKKIPDDRKQMRNIMLASKDYILPESKEQIMWLSLYTCKHWLLHNQKSAVFIHINMYHIDMLWLCRNISMYHDMHCDFIFQLSYILMTSQLNLQWTWNRIWQLIWHLWFPDFSCRC